MSNPINERLEKLLRLAVDPSAAEGERANACMAFVRQVRAVELTYDDVVHALAGPGRRPAAVSAGPRYGQAYDPNSPDGWQHMTMPFGKHRGETLQVIVANDPDYLRWMVENIDFERADLRDAVNEAYEYAESGG